MIDHKPLRKGGAFGHPPTHRPCIECPLRRTATPGYLGGYSAMQYLDVLHGIADIACHLSPGFPADFSGQRSCTGVAMYRANCEIAPLARNAAAAVDHVGKDAATVFTSPVEFLCHHTGKGIKELAEMLVVSNAETLARLVLIFHSSGTPSPLAREFWSRATGTSDITTRALCDYARKVLRIEEQPNKE